jgi:hypothetical protein
MPQSALLGGVFIGVLSALPIVSAGNCCCLWVIGGGLLAAYLEQQNDPRTLQVARGAFVGLLAGVVGAFVWLIAAIALNPLMASVQSQMAEAMLSVASDMPPEARQVLEGIGERASSPFQFVLGFMFQLFIGGVFSTAGGAIGAAFFRRGAPPAPPPPDVPPPLPPQY